MSYLQINENLYVIDQSVTNDKVSDKRGTVNHIWIFDRSGSMWGHLRDLTKQMIVLSKQIPMGDTLTLGYFSGKNEYNFIVKGFKFSSTSDYSIIENAINNNSTTIGLTCFSEILTDTKNVIDDLSVFSKVFSLSFFTDGYPNTHNEEKLIFSAIKDIKGTVDFAIIIGFGNYYNKQLLTSMAEKLGARLIHSSMISEYTDSITRLMDLSGSASSKQEVLPPVKNPIAVYTVTDQGVVVTSVDDETGMVNVSPQGKRSSIYYVSTEAPEDHDEVIADDIAGDFLSGVYASTLVLTQQMKTDLALEIMGAVGDKSFVDGITNAFTIPEYGRIESRIEEAVSNEGARYLDGKDTNYLPPDDAYCVFDVLSKLMDEENISFYPYHDGFVYNKVSKPTIINDDYAKFVPEENAQSAMDDLVWHKSRLNLSVRAIIRGTIDLKEKDGVNAKDVGLSDNFPVFVYRNYTFIKDGIVNVQKFYVSTSLETKKFFEDKGIVVDDGDDFDCDGIYGLDISGLPSINRALAKNNTSATKLCGLLKRDNEISGELKALKDFLKKDFEDTSSFDSPLISDKQRAFLEANGVDIDKGGVYSPKVDSVDSTDMYIARKFDIKIKGLSSLPSVKKVVDKLVGGKKRTLSESVVEVGITKYENFKVGTDDDDMRKLWLNKEIAKLKKEQKGLRTGIQSTKFAILLAKRWFDEFDSRDDKTIEVDDWKFTFELGETTVKL